MNEFEQKERENRVKRCKIDIKTQESKVREARSNLEHGFTKAKAVFEQEYAKLKFDLDREEYRLEMERAYLESAENDLLKPFD